LLAIFAASARQYCLLLSFNIDFFRSCQNPGCDAAIVKGTRKPIQVGAGLRIHAECAAGHKTTWKSGEFVNKGRTSVIDVMISVMQLVIGLNMSQVNGGIFKITFILIGMIGNRLKY
jgi:hypothetical protein